MKIRRTDSPEEEKEEEEGKRVRKGGREGGSREGGTEGKQNWAAEDSAKRTGPHLPSVPRGRKRS